MTLQLCVMQFIKKSTALGWPTKPFIEGRITVWGTSSSLVNEVKGGGCGGVAMLMASILMTRNQCTRIMLLEVNICFNII